MCRTRCIRRPGWLGPAPLIVQTTMLCFDSCCSPTLITRVSAPAAFSPSSATQHPRPGLCVSAALVNPRCCRFADVCAVSVLSGRAIRVAPASIRIAMALQLRILNLPYAVIWNATDTVVIKSHRRLFAGRGRQGNVNLGCTAAQNLEQPWILSRPRVAHLIIRYRYLYLSNAAITKMLF
jgi:hypothetical protein